MTTIRTTCDRCGDVELTTNDIGLVLAPAGNSGSYRFACPLCSEMQRRPANNRVVSILLATGVEYQMAMVSSPITEEEISDFAAALDEKGWFTHISS